MYNQYQAKKALKSIVIHSFLMAVALTCLFPLFWMVRSSLMSNETIFVDKSFFPSEMNVGNYLTAWTQGNFGIYFINSVIYTTSVVVGIVVISSLAAYAFSRLDFPGKNFFLSELKKITFSYTVLVLRKNHQ